jgi:hypothetical protein
MLPAPVHAFNHCAQHHTVAISVRTAAAIRRAYVRRFSRSVRADWAGPYRHTGCLRCGLRRLAIAAEGIGNPTAASDNADQYERVEHMHNHLDGHHRLPRVSFVTGARLAERR